ncbi:MAG TPA: FHA domain-containing protein, partial [Gemmatimonadales bacterium]|nr:FHA domain-containing protein [Gemmatimonadales bacterium]
MKAQFKFLSGVRAGQVEAFRKGYIGLGRHPLSDVRFDAERDLDVSSRHAAIVRKAEGFVLQDLGSRNGTFVNGQRITGETLLRDGDVIGFGANGPALEFAVIESESDLPLPTAAERLAERQSSPREVIQARASPSAQSSAVHANASRQSTGVRIAVEVARQTAQLRRTTKILIVLLLIVGTGFTWIQIDGRRRARESREATAHFQTELQGVRDALKTAQHETARLR